METELDISLLIEKTQELVHDGHIVNAAKGSMHVQDIYIEGKKFSLSVVMERDALREKWISANTGF